MIQWPIFMEYISGGSVLLQKPPFFAQLTEADEQVTDFVLDLVGTRYGAGDLLS